jgi:hypothetical protein
MNGDGHNKKLNELHAKRRQPRLQVKKPPAAGKWRCVFAIDCCQKFDLRRTYSIWFGRSSRRKK